MKKRVLKFCTAFFLCLVSVMGTGTEKVNIRADVSELQGDLNGDGTVNIIDSIYLRQNLLGVSEGYPVTNWKAVSGAVGGNITTGENFSAHKELLIGNEEGFSSVKQVPMYNGIDVSKWQGVVDWERVRNAGIDFVMIKAGEGTSVEETFLRNISGAKKAGIKCGVYWFANARNIEECKAEARACLETIKDYKLEYPVVYDFEYRTLTNNPLENDRELCTEVIYTFLNDIEEAGYYAMLYSNKDFPERYLNIKKLTDRFDFWYANYGIEQPDVSCGMWQRSCTGRVDGIAYDVDLDISYVDYKSVMEKYHLNGY